MWRIRSDPAEKPIVAPVPLSNRPFQGGVAGCAINKKSPFLSGADGVVRKFQQK